VDKIKLQRRGTAQRKGPPARTVSQRPAGAVQLEALTRILLDKGYVTEAELMKMMNKIQVEYQDKK